VAIFPYLETESVIQVNDRTRLGGVRSYITSLENAVTKVEFNPDTVGAPTVWYDVTPTDPTDTTLYYLDWQFVAAGAFTVSLKVTTNTVGPVTATITKDLTVKTVADDNLFSVDSDLTAWEPDILGYTRPGRASFLDIHREAQIQILDWLDEHEIWDKNQNRLTAAAVVDVQEVKQWSKFLTLQIIFEGLSNAIGDIFEKKSQRYAAKAEVARARGQIKLDLNGDGAADNVERISFNSIRVVRS
jgi:hypothetical protein